MKAVVPVLIALLCAQAGAVRAQDAAAAAPEVELPTAAAEPTIDEIKAEIAQLREDKRRVREDQAKVRAEIARVKARIAELEPEAPANE